MSDCAFLDTNICLGYCFTVDLNYRKSNNYVSNTPYELYISDNVENEYQNKKSTLNTRYSKAVNRHVGDLERSSYSGQLGPVDINGIKKNVLHKSNDAYNFLANYYQNNIGNFIQMSDLIDDFRKLSRDIDTLAKNRKNALDKSVDKWQQQKSYPAVDKALSKIHKADREICIESHDLAIHKGGYTEFVTANSSDFVDNGRETLVLNNTELDDIEDLSP